MHWLTLVLVPQDGTDIREAVTRLLSPSPERVFPEYPVECACIGFDAIMHGYNTVDADPAFASQQQKREGLDQETWERFLQIRKQAATEAARRHPLYEKPDPDCDVCHGSGVRQATRDPGRHWDWWRIGGRWDGVIVGTPRRESEGNSGEEHELLDFNCVPVTQLPAGFIPSAIITPDGLWFEDHHWDSDDPIKGEEWRGEASGLLARYTDCLAVAVDCHF